MCCSTPVAVYKSLCLPRNPDIIYPVYDYIKDYHSIFILLILLGSCAVYSYLRNPIKMPSCFKVAVLIIFVRVVNC